MRWPHIHDSRAASSVQPFGSTEGPSSLGMPLHHDQDPVQANERSAVPKVDAAGMTMSSSPRLMRVETLASVMAETEFEPVEEQTISIATNGRLHKPAPQAAAAMRAAQRRRTGNVSPRPVQTMARLTIPMAGGPTPGPTGSNHTNRTGILIKSTKGPKTHRSSGRSPRLARSMTSIFSSTTCVSVSHTSLPKPSAKCWRQTNVVLCLLRRNLETVTPDRPQATAHRAYASVHPGLWLWRTARSPAESASGSVKM